MWDDGCHGPCVGHRTSCSQAEKKELPMTTDEHYFFITTISYRSHCTTSAACEPLQRSLYRSFGFQWQSRAAATVIEQLRYVSHSGVRAAAAVFAPLLWLPAAIGSRYSACCIVPFVFFLASCLLIVVSGRSCSLGMVGRIHCHLFFRRISRRAYTTNCDSVDHRQPPLTTVNHLDG